MAAPAKTHAGRFRPPRNNDGLLLADHHSASGVVSIAACGFVGNLHVMEENKYSATVTWN